MEDTEEMFVTKRNGKKEIISFNKISKRLKNIGKETGINLNFTSLAMKVIDQLYDGIETEKIDELAAEQCASMSAHHPDYSTIAGYIAISNHQSKTSDSFYESMRQLYKNVDIHNKSSPLISEDLWRCVITNRKTLETFIDYKRDFLIDYFGFKTLEKSYLLRTGKNIVERPQHLWLRVAIGIHKDDLDKIQETYEMLSQKFFTHATPTLFNAGTPRPQLSSCYLLSMEDDSIDGIFNTLKECANISKWAGGIGLHIHNVRAKGSYIRGTNGVSNGIMPMLRVFNNAARYVDQCLTSDSILYTTRGPKRICDVVDNNDFCFNRYGNKEYVKNKMEYSYEGNVYNIISKYIFSNTNITPEHPVLAVDANTIFPQESENFKWRVNPTWKSVNKLNYGDYLMIPRPKYSRDIASLKSDDCYFYGLMLVFGYINESDNYNYIKIPDSKFTGNKSELETDIEDYLSTRMIQYEKIQEEYAKYFRWKKTCNFPFRTTDLHSSFETFAEYKLYYVQRLDVFQNISNVISIRMLNLPVEKLRHIVRGMLKYNWYITECYKFRFNECFRIRQLDAVERIERYRYMFLKIGIMPYYQGKYKTVSEHYNRPINEANDNSGIQYMCIPRNKKICSIMGDTRMSDTRMSDDFDLYNVNRTNRVRNTVATAGDYDEYLNNNNRSECNGRSVRSGNIVRSARDARDARDILNMHSNSIKNNRPESNIESDVKLLNSVFYVPIEGLITKPYKGAVYDLEMAEEHNYVSSVGIMHNGGGRRNGSFAIYMEPWHSDIETFLDMRKNHGEEESRARDLFYALWIPDLFMQRVKNNEDWTLMCPDECCGLQDTYGDKFNELYLKYESESKGKKTIKARELWFQILDSQMETGTPYLLYKDACNKKSNQKNLGVIKSSNLCTEIIEYSDKDESAVCNLASISLGKFVDENTHTYDYAELHKTAKVVTRNLNKIIDINFYPTPKTQKSNFLHRPIGIGVQGLADTFFKMDLPFHSEDASEINSNIFETIYHAALETSCEISEERGKTIRNFYEVSKELYNFDWVSEFSKYDIKKDSRPITLYNIKTHYPNIYNLISSNFRDYLEHTDILKSVNLVFAELGLKDMGHEGCYSSFKGSPASEGILQFDMWDNNETTEPQRYDWDAMRLRVKSTGIRNSLLLAPMPTASTSQILGNNECFEPVTSNIYTRRTMAGEFMVINKYLMRELIELGVWNEDLKQNIIANNGSIQHLDMLSEELKFKYKTVWEIPMKHLINMARDRGRFICQSQSLNLWMEDPDYSSLTAMHFYSWSQGLKTGIYYLRRKPKHQAQQFTIEPDQNNMVDDTEDEICEMCSG